MATFTPLESETSVELQAAQEWIEQRLEAERVSRSLPVECTWTIQVGRRDAGPPRGPRLTQVGVQIQMEESTLGTRRPLGCFIAADDIHDEEQQPVVEQVLVLWLDRVLEDH
jgi:hypothetical protein